MRMPQVQPKIKFSLLASLKRNEEKPHPIWSLNPLALARGFASIPQPHSFQMSQAGQDLWVFGEVFNEKRGGYFLDLGAHDGISISNTYLLERKHHWTGICVEANPDSFQQLRKNRRAICVQACLDSTEGFVNFAKRDVMGGIVSTETDNKGIENKIDEVIRIENKAPIQIDCLSIDVEGAEQRVLGDFNFKKY